MALIIPLKESNALRLNIDIQAVIDDLQDCGYIGETEDGQQMVMLDTLTATLEALNCSIVCKPNYVEGGTTVVFGGPKEIIVTQMKNKNTPHLSSSGK